MEDEENFELPPEFYLTNDPEEPVLSDIYQERFKTTDTERNNHLDIISKELDARKWDNIYYPRKNKYITWIEMIEEVIKAPNPENVELMRTFIERLPDRLKMTKDKLYSEFIRHFDNYEEITNYAIKNKEYSNYLKRARDVLRIELGKFETLFKLRQAELDKVRMEEQIKARDEQITKLTNLLKNTNFTSAPTSEIEKIEEKPKRRVNV
jgi:hypothetical protein